jgi:hypothetical protein
MPADIALSIAIAFVTRESDASLARELDAADLGAAGAGSTGVVISCDRGVTVRVSMQPLAAVSSSSLVRSDVLDRDDQPDCDGALELALAELGQSAGPRSLIVTDVTVPEAFRNRAAARAVDILCVRGAIGDAARMAIAGGDFRRKCDPPEAMRSSLRPRSAPDLVLPAPEDHAPISALAAAALLGVAAVLVRRSG